MPVKRVTATSFGFGAKKKPAILFLKMRALLRLHFLGLVNAIWTTHLAFIAVDMETAIKCYYTHGFLLPGFGHYGLLTDTASWGKFPKNSNQL